MKIWINADIMPTIIRAFIGVTLLGIAACSQPQPRPDLPNQTAIPPGFDGPIDHAAVAEEALHSGQSAFRLVTEGTEAFVTRAHTAHLAARSIDVQTYIWHTDLTGLYLAHKLIEAADRGVKVRLLLDDLDARAKNAGVAALAAHPNIEVRLFNPFASRWGTLRKIGEGLANFNRLNRRMHNKTWIVDNRIAVAGGRNIGDEYFSASEAVNFFDLDFAMIGPVVRDASASFDKYWNSSSAYPVEVLDADAVNVAALDRLRAALAVNVDETETGRYASALRGDDAVKRMAAGDWPMEWSSRYRFISDDPAKVTMQEQNAERTAVGSALLLTMSAAQTDLTVISPYFVPGEAGARGLADAARSGQKVRILTNSLIANDVAAVHGAYSQYRKPLLEGGVQLWELKPQVTQISAHSSFFGSSGASLHTKALSVDDRHLFVGSFNLDPRSTWLNCEQGVLVESAALTRQFAAIFAAQTSPQHAWHVTLTDGDLHWSDDVENFDSDPQASAWRRFQAWFARAMNLEAQL